MTKRRYQNETPPVKGVIDFEERKKYKGDIVGLSQGFGFIAIHDECGGRIHRSQDQKDVFFHFDRHLPDDVLSVNLQLGQKVEIKVRGTDRGPVVEGTMVFLTED